MKVYRKELKSCWECPNCSHGGKWCDAKQDALFFDEDFPEWCPLPDYQFIPGKLPGDAGQRRM